MSTQIVYIDQSDVRPGKLELIEPAGEALVRFVEEAEPQILSYGFFLTADGSKMSVVAVHPDSPSMERHLEVGGPAFRGFQDLITLRSIDVYGQPSDAVVEQLRAKAQMLGASEQAVAIHDLRSGFTRSPR